jgi:hypothetical protein
MFPEIFNKLSKILKILTPTYDADEKDADPQHGIIFYFIILYFLIMFFRLQLLILPLQQVR